MLTFKRTQLALFIASLSLLDASAHAYSTKSGKIYDNSGNQIAINGIAWIGFQDSNFLGGLWSVAFNPYNTENGAIQLLTSPWLVPTSGVTTANGVAFKSIRLPIQPGIWHDATTIQSSPFDFSRTSQSAPTTGNGPFCDWTAGADGSGHCVKSLTAPNLLNATINEFNKQNLYVMLDFHHRPGLGDNFRDGTVVASDYSLQNYHDDIVNFVKTAPANVFGIDIFNEPHQLFWFQDNTQISPVQPAWIKVIAAAAAAVHDTNPAVLLFVEAPGGTNGNDPYDPVYSSNSAICFPASTKVDDTSVIGLSTDPARCPTPANPLHVNNIGSNWGENFRSLLDPAQSANGVAKFNASNFRTLLISALKTNNFSATDPDTIADWLLGTNNDGNNGHIVFAPHLYGSAVAGWQSDANDSKIRFQWNFGFLQDSGFPFVVGELGYDTQQGGEDFFLNSVAPYLIAKQIPNNLFFWTFNNSDNPAGIRASDSNLTLYAWKEQDLHNLFNSIPPVLTYGTLCVTVPAPTGYSGTAFPVITATGSSNYVFNLTQFDTLTCNNQVVTGNYSLTGNNIVNADGTVFQTKQASSATVTTNTETDVTMQYAQQPGGTLQITVAGNSDCTIVDNQQFIVGYSNSSLSKQVTVIGTTPVSIQLPAGTYTISVAPTTLPNNTKCNANFAATVNVSANATAQENINYTASAATSCTVKTQCSTWGNPTDPWAGSSCNLFITTQTPMSNPAVLKMSVSGISSLSGVWNATGVLSGGTLAMTLTDPVNVTNIGFNANGIIVLPQQASLSTNGQNYTCNVTTS